MHKDKARPPPDPARQLPQPQTKQEDIPMSNNYQEAQEQLANSFYELELKARKERGEDISGEHFLDDYRDKQAAKQQKNAELMEALGKRMTESREREIKAAMEEARAKAIREADAETAKRFGMTGDPRTEAAWRKLAEDLGLPKAIS